MEIIRILAEGIIVFEVRRKDDNSANENNSVIVSYRVKSNIYKIRAFDFIGRWMKYLESNGNAKYLNLFVLENGYNEILFLVIEFYDGDEILRRENMWKSILGTVNYNAYKGVQLNNN